MANLSRSNINKCANSHRQCCIVYWNEGKSQRFQFLQDVSMVIHSLLEESTMLFESCIFTEITNLPSFISNFECIETKKF